MEQWLNRFIEVRLELIELIKPFSEAQAEETLFGAWNLCQVLAHLIGWDFYFTELLSSLKAGLEPLYWGSIQEFNKSSVAQREDQTWQEVYDEFIRVGEAFISAYRDVESEMEEAKFWKERSYTPTRILQVNLHHYEKSHLPEIKKVGTKLQPHQSG